MGVSRAFGTLTVCAMALSPTAVAAASSSDCERVVVEAESSDHVEHTGTFYQVGTALDDTPLFKSNGGYCLQYIEEGSVADEDYSTFMELSTGSESEPADVGLDTELPTVAAEEVFDRRSLQRCGYWVIGVMGTADTAMYPMLKVSDCADHPALIDEDSSWFRQDCHDCEQSPDIGYVTIFTEAYPCGSFTWAPAATPTPTNAENASPTTIVVETPTPPPAETGGVVVQPTTTPVSPLSPTSGPVGSGDGGGEPTTPVFPLSPTTAPVGGGGGGGGDDETVGEDDGVVGEDGGTVGEDDGNAAGGDGGGTAGEGDDGTVGEDGGSAGGGDGGGTVSDDGAGPSSETGGVEDGDGDEEDRSVDIGTAGEDENDDNNNSSSDDVDGVAVGVGVGVGVAVLAVVGLVVAKKMKS